MTPGGVCAGPCQMNPSGKAVDTGIDPTSPGSRTKFCSWCGPSAVSSIWTCIDTLLEFCGKKLATDLAND